MMAAKFNPDPSDLTQGTIQSLFYSQIKALTMQNNSTDRKIRTFDYQFSDAWF